VVKGVNWHLLLLLPKMTQISDKREKERHETPEDDNSWEDLSDDEPRRRSKPRSTSSNSFRSATKSSARRRTPKPTPKPTPRRWNVYEDHGSPVRAPRELSVSPGPPPPRPAAVVPGPSLLVALPSGVDVLRYISDILGTVFRVLKIPISLVLATIACLYVISLASGAIRTALAPICSIPIVGLACPSLEPIKPKPIPNSGRVPRRPDFPGLLNVESKSLEALLDESAEGPGLALEIKKAEMATTDLVTLVHISKLNSREVLADSLRNFVKDARKVSRGLTRFSSRVGGAVDNIIAVNEYALGAIEAADAKSSSLSRFLPFGKSESKQVVMQTFTEAMNTLSTNMQRLVLEAEVSISDLNKLEEHLISIHEIVSRENSSISVARGELLAQTTPCSKALADIGTVHLPMSLRHCTCWRRWRRTWKSFVSAWPPPGLLAKPYQ
jgi:hypothetical protein